MRRIPLRRRDGTVRAYALVDDEDYEWLRQWRWSYLKAGDDGGYAIRFGPSPQRQCFLMHRQIMGMPSVDVDHEDGNGLNNRRANLRVGSHARNLQNRRGANSNSRSGVRGVSWDKKRRKWLAQATLDGRNHYLGGYVTIEEAARVVEAWRATHMPFSEDAAAA